jgi:hypothetical protein
VHSANQKLKIFVPPYLYFRKRFVYIERMKTTMKAFREVLNARHAGTENHRNYAFHQRTRGYGDYLYFQDREMFDMEYAEWKRQQEQK